MASTYSTNLKIELIGSGEQAGTWGATTNTNLGTTLEQAIGGKATVTFSSTTETLTLTNSNAAQNARALYLDLDGTPGGAATLEVPAIQKFYIVKNGTGEQVTIKVSGQTGVVIPNGKTVVTYNNGTDVVTAIDYIPSLTLGAALPVASGGTGITAFGTGVATALGVNTGSAGAFVVNGGALGTPSSGTLTNATGLPISTGVSGLGTNVATALAVNVGSSGAFVTNGGALGTPSSGTLSSCTIDGTNSVGFRNTPINSQSANYTLILTDSGKTIYHPASDTNDRTFTIPANASVAYPTGTVVTFINLSANDLTIDITSDTMYLLGPGSTGSRTITQYGVASAIKLESTTWAISGNGLS